MKGMAAFITFIYEISHPSANGKSPFWLEVPQREDLWHLPSQQALPLDKGSSQKASLVCCMSRASRLKSPSCPAA